MSLRGEIAAALQRCGVNSTRVVRPRHGDVDFYCPVKMPPLMAGDCFEFIATPAGLIGVRVPWQRWLEELLKARPCVVEPDGGRHRLADDIWRAAERMLDVRHAALMRRIPPAAEWWQLTGLSPDGLERDLVRDVEHLHFVLTQGPTPARVRQSMTDMVRRFHRWFDATPILDWKTERALPRMVLADRLAIRLEDGMRWLGAPFPPPRRTRLSGDKSRPDGISAVEELKRSPSKMGFCSTQPDQPGG